MALLIAVSCGHVTDSYTTSVHAPTGLDLSDKMACRDAIAQAKQLPIHSIDYVLVVEGDEVTHNYGGQEGFEDPNPNLDDDPDEEV